jgi:prevent-host-death family protein
MISQDSQPVTIPATVAHRKFGELVRRAFSGEHFIVEKDGLPVVAIISMTEYKQLIADQEAARTGSGNDG